MAMVSYSNNDIKFFNKSEEIFDDNQSEIIELTYSCNLKKLPKEICNLTNLKIFQCNYMQRKINIEEMTEKIPIFMPLEIGKLDNLREFYCTCNFLVYLPKELGNLKNLKLLDCSYNELIEIPDEIYNLKKLKHLNLRHNHLKEISKDIHKLVELKFFACHYNNLKELPIEIINCINLKTIHCLNNEIVMNPIIQRFIDRINNINNHNLYGDTQSVHASSIQKSIKESIINLLNDKYY